MTVIGRSALWSFMISILAYKQWRINQTLQARDDPRSGPGKYLSIGFEDFRNLVIAIHDLASDASRCYVIGSNKLGTMLPEPCVFEYSYITSNIYIHVYSCKV